MKTELIIALLGLACIGSLAAAFVLWAKVDELKKSNANEHANYLAALNLHNATAEAAQENDRFLREIYAAEDGLTRECNLNLHLLELNYELQDRLSALLCPMNDHVWEVSDAYRGECRCKKCGRIQK